MIDYKQIVKECYEKKQHFHLLATTTKNSGHHETVNTNFSVALVASWLKFWFQLL